MYNIRKSNIFKNWNTTCYIAKKMPSIFDEYGNEIPIYKEPKSYTFNIQPVLGESESREFGELISNMRVAVITQRDKYFHEFHPFDLAYLDGATPKEELVVGQNANYRVYDVRPQNVVLKVYFLKIDKGEKI